NQQIYKMPRRSSSSSRTSSSRSTATAQRPAYQPTRPVQQPPVQQQKSGGIFSGLGSTLMTGMAFGAGSEVAHQAIRSVIGGGSGHGQQQVEQQQQQQQQYQQPQQQLCGDETQSFTNCLKNYQEISMCQTYMDILKECQKRNI
ncbi:p8mtcp1, putative, partial [Ichthyophthirius multifiliis]